jgi:hypothetical protein
MWRRKAKYPHASMHRAALARVSPHDIKQTCRPARRPQGISDKRLRAYITLQAAHGMEYLHLNYMVHFDLKVGDAMPAAKQGCRRTVK